MHLRSRARCRGDFATSRHPFDTRLTVFRKGKALRSSDRKSRKAKIWAQRWNPSLRPKCVLCLSAKINSLCSVGQSDSATELSRRRQKENLVFSTRRKRNLKNGTAWKMGQGSPRGCRSAPMRFFTLLSVSCYIVLSDSVLFRVLCSEQFKLFFEFAEVASRDRELEFVKGRAEPAALCGVLDGGEIVDVDDAGVADSGQGRV